MKRLFFIMVLSGLFSVIVLFSVYALYSSHEDHSRYACIDESGEIFKSAVPCMARNNEICSKFNDKDILAAINLATNGNGIFFEESKSIGKDLAFVLPGRVILVEEIIDLNGFENDEIILRDVVSKELINVKITSQGNGLISDDDVVYELTYFTDSIKIDFPQTTKPWGVDLSVCF